MLLSAAHISPVAKVIAIIPSVQVLVRIATYTAIKVS